MAIYVSETMLDDNISDAVSNIPEYGNDDTFRAGFDTCIDVVTCFNEYSAWHIPSVQDMPEGTVLIAIPEKRAIRTAYWAGEVWHTDGAVFQPEQVSGWMELPDFPDDMEASVWMR